MKASLFFLILFFSAPVMSAQLIWDFSDRADLDSGDLVYNQTLGVLHPSLSAISGVSTVPMEVGDGRDGAFVRSTYQDFSENGDISGNTIRLNTDDFPQLQVTNFELEAGWVIDVQGSQPLTILSQSDVILNGQILCQGNSGTDAVGAIPGVGGLGRCGGGDGGDGGVAFADGLDGGDASSLVTGGQGGNYTAPTAVSGGGGGSWNNSTSAGNGNNATGAGGTAGSMQSDPDFSEIAGGSGGGGGSGYNVDAGAGGGGGGGTVIINTARNFVLGTAGEIRAFGGNGGVSDGTGGSGGGGGGGSVRVFAGKDITITNPSFQASDARQGNGGSNGLLVGGVGGSGRNWFSNADSYTAAGGYSPTEEVPFAPGAVFYSANIERAQSISYDLQNTRVTFNSLVPSPASSDFLLEVSGSDDDFESDSTGWTTDLTSLERKRFVKFRASITATDTSTPDMLTSITLNYDPGDANQFDFEAAGCAKIAKVKPPGPFLSLLLLPLFALLFGFKIQSQE